MHLECFRPFQLSGNRNNLSVSRIKIDYFLHKYPSKNYLFVELHEQGSVAKVHRIEIVLSLGEKILVKGPGEQNELFRLSRTSRPST